MPLSNTVRDTSWGAWKRLFRKRDRLKEMQGAGSLAGWEFFFVLDLPESGQIRQVLYSLVSTPK